MNTREHSTGLIDGGTASNWLGASANNARETDNAYDYFGLKDPVKIAIADDAITDVVQLLDYLASRIPNYEEPSRLKRFLNSFGPPSRSDSVAVNIVDLAGYIAEAKKISSYLIEISAGLVLRTASLCNEYAAIQFDGASAPTTPSVWPVSPDGGMFYLMPKSEAGKQYARRLLLISMLFLFGHELSHISYGHCALFPDSLKMSVDERCAVELDADMGAGAFAAGSIIQNRKVMELLGYSAGDFDAAAIMDVVRDGMMGALIQFILFEEFTTKDSPMYLVPLFRFKNFVANFVAYLGWSPSAPFGPAVPIGGKGLVPDQVNFAYLACAAELMRTSAGPVLRDASVAQSDLDRAEHASRVRARLKEKLVPLQPFGTPKYLAQVRKSQKAHTRGGSVSRT
jgi:hypothetical protein